MPESVITPDVCPSHSHDSAPDPAPGLVHHPDDERAVGLADLLGVLLLGPFFLASRRAWLATLESTVLALCLLAGTVALSIDHPLLAALGWWMGWNAVAGLGLWRLTCWQERAAHRKTSAQAATGLGLPAH